MTRDDELNQALEAMFYGFRAMTKKPDEQLLEFGYSRIHHRILYFIGRNPQCSVQELLNILEMSKQYINKPLRTLINDGYVKQQADKDDKRIKRLTLSIKGKQLEDQLSETQRKRFEMIFEKTGKQAEQHWHGVMRLLICLE